MLAIQLQAILRQSLARAALLGHHRLGPAMLQQALLQQQALNQQQALLQQQALQRAPDIGHFLILTFLGHLLQSRLHDFPMGQVAAMSRQTVMSGSL